MFLTVHGGAWNIPHRLRPAHEGGCEAAWQAGMGILSANGTAVEAVRGAIRVLEDDPTFDAGIGSFLNEDGAVELDAGLMEGKDLNSGAVLGIAGIANPIDLAVHILHNSEHCLFQGEGAMRYAKRNNFKHVAQDYHVIERERDNWQAIADGDQTLLKTAWTSGHDTVGAIALDRFGNLAAGNSTGGTLFKQQGRVGDAALAGVGFYADNRIGGVVCTGWGEGIMRSGMAMRALSMLERGAEPKEAAQAAVAHAAERVGGYGGIMVLNTKAKVGIAYNTEHMAYRHG